MTDRHLLVYVFLRHMHLRNHHEGVDYIHALIQQKYAVLKLRSILHWTSFNFVRCSKRNSWPAQPMMADLPSEWLAFQNPPPTNVGLEHWGPFYVSIRRSSEKKWRFILTCLTTTAVHVEITYSSDTKLCAMGIESFIACRGMPLVICSDKGANFVSTVKELLLCLLNLDKQKIASKMAQKGVKWKFKPPAATTEVFNPPRSCLGKAIAQLQANAVRNPWKSWAHRRNTTNYILFSWTITKQLPIDCR